MDKKNLIQVIAVERMHRLIELAEQEFQSHPERSKRFIELIKKISSRNKARIPLELRQRFCKKCNTFWIEGKNVQKRIKGKSVSTKCLKCGQVKRINLTPSSRRG